MTFDNQYLTYSEYKELGGTLEELPFNKLEFECKKIIDEKTQNRLSNIDDIPEEVQMCEYKMIDCINNYQEQESKAQKGITSENTDGYSVSYGSIENTIKAKSSELEDIVTNYLFGVIINNEHLIYLGVK